MDYSASAPPKLNHLWASPVTGFFSLLSVTPPIFYVWYRDGLEYLLDDLKDRPVDILLMFDWHQDESMVAPLAQNLARWRQDYPLARFHCLANTREEATLLRQRTGCQTILCSAAALLDEGLWRPDPAASEPQYDAMLDGTLAPLKRHALAAHVPRLAVISYTYVTKFNPTYAQQAADALKSAHWFNHPLSPDYHFLPTEEVLAAYRQCRVGLILSEKEGACYASLQYLLAGLPVVSTPSLGGRDLFYNEHNCIIAEPKPEAIRKAVATWIKRAPAPEAIRAATLPLLEEHRRNLIALVNQILSDRGAKPDFAARWPEIFFNKLWVPARYRLAVESIRQGRDLVHPRSRIGASYLPK